MVTRRMVLLQLLLCDSCLASPMVSDVLSDMPLLWPTEWLFEFVVVLVSEFVVVLLLVPWEPPFVFERPWFFEYCCEQEIMELLFRVIS